MRIGGVVRDCARCAYDIFRWAPIFAAIAGKRIVLTTLGLYRSLISPVMVGLMGPACRFEPSCSAYARMAIAVHGVIRGSILALRRILRCRPGGGWGCDPVPPPQVRGRLLMLLESWPHRSGGGGGSSGRRSGK